jgi:hypothetical protein
MKYFFPTIIALMLALCSCHNKKPAKADAHTAKNAPRDTISALDQLGERDSAVFTAPNGISYSVRKVSGADKNSEAEAEKPAPRKSGDWCNGELFDGKDRKAAKTSVAKANFEVFEDLDALLKTLPPDKEIGSIRKPAISTDEKSNRVAEENRNVRIKKTWVYTFARESDEDYHVIIGSTPDSRTAVFFTVEISGLPARTQTELSKARNEFIGFFGLGGFCGHGYTHNFSASPVEAEIAGSLFFDKHHYNSHGKIGPAFARSTTYWEIHPVTDIRFKSNPPERR